MSRLALTSRRVLTPSGLRPATVTVESGKVVGLDPPGGVAEDLGDLVLMPGLVDGHVHVNEPGRTEWEGFVTATAAAAAGGITSIVDMPLNCIPVTTTRDAFRMKLLACEGKLSVDCGFWGGIVPGNVQELRPMIEAGVLGFKAFLCHSGIDDFPASDEAVLRAAMPVLAAGGVPLLVHAELELESAVEAGSVRTYRRYLQSRPPAWEDAAIRMMVRLCRDTGCAVHVVHLSSGSAVEILAAARAEGLPITVETCPHYLCLAAEDIADGDTAFKCAPPIRGAANREQLWEGLARGVIDVVVSDHSPCTPGLKLLDRGDFESAWGGIASLQLGLSAVWTEACRRGFGLTDLSRWMSQSPARVAGLSSRKGGLSSGMDADLVAWDPDASWTVTPELLRHRHKVTPWLGRELRGQVVATWLRGERVGLGPPRGVPLRGREH